MADPLSISLGVYALVTAPFLITKLANFIIKQRSTIGNFFKSAYNFVGSGLKKTFNFLNAINPLAWAFHFIKKAGKFALKKLGYKLVKIFPVEPTPPTLIEQAQAAALAARQAIQRQMSNEPVQTVTTAAAVSAKQEVETKTANESVQAVTTAASAFLAYYLFSKLGLAKSAKAAIVATSNNAKSYAVTKAESTIGTIKRLNQIS